MFIYLDVTFTHVKLILEAMLSFNVTLHLACCNLKLINARLERYIKREET